MNIHQLGCFISLFIGLSFMPGTILGLSKRSYELAASTTDMHDMTTEDPKPSIKPFGSVFEIDNKTYYLETYLKANWYAAYQFCRFHGLKLVTISSFKENEFIGKNIRKSGLGNDYFWTAANDLAESYRFTWMTTGQSVTFHNFINMDKKYGEYWTTTTNDYDYTTTTAKATTTTIDYDYTTKTTRDTAPSATTIPFYEGPINCVKIYSAHYSPTWFHAKCLQKHYFICEH